MRQRTALRTKPRRAPIQSTYVQPRSLPTYPNGSFDKHAEWTPVAWAVQPFKHTREIATHYGALVKACSHTDCSTRRTRTSTAADRRSTCSIYTCVPVHTYQMRRRLCVVFAVQTTLASHLTQTPKQRRLPLSQLGSSGQPTAGHRGSSDREPRKASPQLSPVAGTTKTRHGASPAQGQTSCYSGRASL